MKKFIPLILAWLVTLIFTGCYTHIAVDDSYIYQEPQPIIIILPAPYPQPIPLPAPPHYPPTKPVQPVYKIQKPVPPPPNNDRIRDDIRNSGGRNDGGKRSRR